jgi:hypothetical protein
LYYLGTRDFTSGVDIKCAAGEEALLGARFALSPEMAAEVWCGSRCLGKVIGTWEGQTITPPADD